MRKLTLLITTLFLSVGMAWAQTLVPVPVLELSAKQIGTEYPKQLDEVYAQKVYALDDLTIAVRINTNSVSGRMSLFATSDPTQAANTNAEGMNSRYVGLGMNGADCGYLASWKSGDRFTGKTYSGITANTVDMVVTYVVNPTNKTFKVFVNGNLERSWSGNSVGFMNGYEIATPRMVKEDYSNANIYIGGAKNSGGNGEVFNGTITGIQVYDGALTATEVAAIKFSTPVELEFVNEVSDFKNGTIYTFVTERGWMGAKADNDKVISTVYTSNGVTGDKTNANFQWTVYKSESNNYYLYNIGKGQFMGVESVNNTAVPFVETPAGTKLTFKKSGSADYPIMFSTDNAAVVNHSGVHQFGLISWTGGWNNPNDGGSNHKVESVGILDESTLSTIKELVTEFELSLAEEYVASITGEGVGYATAASIQALQNAIKAKDFTAIQNTIDDIKTIQPEAGKYYMIVSKHDGYAAGRMMAVDANSNGLIWNSDDNVSNWFKFVDAGNNDKFYLYNVKSGRYMSTANASSNNQQFANATTTTEAKKITITNMGNSNIVKFVPEGGAMLHAQNGGNVVCWDSDAYTSASAWTIVEVENPGVAYIDNTNYATLADAVAAWSEGKTIYLLASTDETIVLPKGMKLDVINFNGFTAPNVTEAPTEAKVATLAELQDALANSELPIIITKMIEIPTSETVELNLNGKTVNVAWENEEAGKHIYAFTNRGTLTITGEGTINTRGIFNYGNMTLTSGTINAIDHNGGYGVRNYSGSEFVMTGGKLAAINENGDPAVTGNYDATALGIDAGAKVTINGGSISSVSNFTYAVHTSGELTVADGSIFGRGGISVNGGVTVITGGTISNDSENDATGHAVYIDGGKLKISGGNFIATNDQADGNSVVYVAAGAEATISGGKFTTNEYTKAPYGPEGNSIAISGGTFDKEISEKYCAEGYVPAKNADGTFGVTEFVPVAMIGEQGYATLTEALAAAKEMTGDVTVEIYDKVTFNQPLIGNYTSINFVGKAENAEMYLDVQGYTTATGKEVTFTDLKLSKSEGSHIANAGFMNVAFGIYDVKKVTYNNCTFLNGAYASSGEVTFNGCTFKKSWANYGLWAYGAPSVTVEGCTFADIRGIKLWDEGSQNLGALTVKNTNFSAVTDKPAIVLTSGKSVVLEDNTYSSTGTFELDLDGNPNGTPVTSDVLPTCKNDKGACGVLVDGKIYTTVAQAAEVATSGSTVTLLHNSAETVALPMGVTLNKNNFEAAGVTVAVPVAKIGDVEYATLAAAVEAAQAGDEIVVIAAVADVTVAVTKNLTISGAATLNNVGINANGADALTVKGLTFTGNSWINSGTAEALTVSGVTATVAPNNTTYTNSRSAFISLGRSEGQELALTLENNSITVTTEGPNAVLGWAKITAATITGNVVKGSSNGYFTNADAIKFMSIANGAEFVIKNNEIWSNFNGIVFAQNTTRNNAYSVYADANKFVGGADHIWIEITGGNTVHATVNATSANTVNGNAFTVGDIKYHDGVIKTWSSYAGVDVVTNENGKVIGGTLASYSNEECIAEGYEIGTNGAVGKASVAEVNGVKYASLAAAVEAAQAGETITILKNTEFAGAALNGKVILDLNGKTVTSTGNYFFWLQDDELVIKDSSAEKTGKLYGVTTGNAVILYGNSTLVVEGVEIFSNNNVITTFEPNNTVTINGGKLEANSATANSAALYLVGSQSTVTVNAGLFIGDISFYYGTLVVNGGSFTKDVSGYCASGFVAEKNNETGMYEVVALTAANAAVKMGDSFYASVASALAAAKAANLTDLVITIIGKNTAATADNFALYDETLFNNVTLKQENGGKAYYINELYTGSRTDNGEFVFDGVNIVVTGQYINQCKTVLKNNSMLKRSNDTKNFIMGEMVVEAGSKYDSQIDDIYAGSITVDGGKTDGTYNEAFDFRSIYFNATYAPFVVKNGAYVLINAANENGTLTVSNKVSVQASKVDVFSEIIINANATLALDAKSIVTTKKITGAGKINVDATGLTEKATVIKGNMSGFTGTINVEGGKYEITSEGLVIKEQALTGIGTAEDPFLIDNVEDLEFFKASVNAGETKYNAPGVWVALAADIDLANAEWTEGIGDGHNYTFDGNFDGKNHTIKNLNIKPYADADNYICGGLFGYTYGGVTIKNLVIENAKVEFADAVAGKNYHNVGVLVGFAYNKDGQLNVDNVIVKGDINVDAPQTYGVGAIVGYSYGAMGAITNTKVLANAGSYIKGQRFVGGITGYSHNNAVINECTVKNLAISGAHGVAGIAGLALNGNKITNCTVENVTVEAESNVAYIVGELQGEGGDVTIADNDAPQPWVGGSWNSGESLVAAIGTQYYTSIAKAIEAAKAGETIVLIRDITASDIITINKAITLDGNGKKLTSTAARAINIETEGKVVINNLTVEAGERAFNIINKPATVELNGVTATANNNAVMIATTAGAAKVSINDCNFTGLAVVNVAGAESNVAIKNSTITNVDASTSEKYGAITVWSSAKAAVVNVENTEINVAGDSMEAYVFPGDAIVNGVEQVGYIVATIGDGGYETLASAIGSAKGGDVITLVRDITASAAIVIDKAITLDGNGKTLTSTETGVNARAINVSGADGVTIKNLTIDAKGERAINVIQNATNVTIENVTATATNYTVNVAKSAPAAVVTIKGSDLTGLNVVNVASAGANVTIDNTTITTVDNSSAEGYSAICLNKDAVNGKIVATNTTVELTGSDASDSKAAKNGAQGGYVSLNGSTDGVAVDVAYISYGTTYYGFATIEAAIAKAEAGETIGLLRDVTVAEKITIAKSITLDGNGKTITYTGSDRAIDVPAADGVNLEVTIKNLTVDCTSSYCQRGINYNEDGKLTLEGVTVKGTNVTYALNLPGSSDNAVVTINESNFSGNIALNVWGANSQITATNSVFTSVDKSTAEGYVAISLNNDGAGNAATGSVVTINGGKIIAKDDKGEPSTAVRVETVATVNVSEETEVVGSIKRDVVIVTYEGSTDFYSFDNLQSAINKAIESKGTVVLLDNITIAEKITISASVVIDGNGKTITYTGSDRAIDVPANADAKVNVTIENLTVDCTASYCQRGINYNDDGALKLNNVTVKGTNVTYALNLPGSSDNAVVTINGGSYTGNIALNVWGENSTINATNTTFTAVDNNTVEGYAAVKLNNDGTTSAEGSVITITGGKIDVTGSACTDTEATSNGTSTGKINISNSTVVNGENAEMVAVIRYADGNSYSFMTIEDAIAKAQAGETVTLLRDITASEIITINKAITLDGNGKKLTSTAGRAINIETEGKVVINNLTVKAGERAFNIINKPATVELNGVTATANNNAVMIATTAGAAKVSINDCNLTGLAVVNVAGAESNVAIKKSTITNVDASTSEKYGAITVWSSAKAAVVNVEDTEINVAGDSMEAYVFPGDAIVNGVEQVGYIVATIGDGGYETLANAIGSAKAGDVITLVRDITASEIITINKAITLDGNGKTLTSTAARAINVDGADGVTIKNLTINASGERAINVINGSTNVTIDNVTATAANYTVNLAGSAANAVVTVKNSNLTGLNVVNVAAAGAEVTVTGGTLVCNDQTDVENYAALFLNENAKEATITATGVTFDIKGDSKKAHNAAADGTITIDGETEDVEVAVAYISYGDNAYTFNSIEAAIEAAQAGETVVLFRDITASEIITINKAITIDLGGKKVTANCRKAFEVYANTTIKNGTIEALNRCVDTRKAVELTLENVKLVADNYTTAYGNPQPLTIGGSENGTKVAMTNVNISAAAGYGIITFVETELTATNSTIGGYSALYVKPGSDNSVFNFVDSDLSGSTVGNDVEGNSFSVIAVRANNVTVDVDAASTVTAAGNYSYAISFKSSYQNEVATGSSVTVAGEITGNILADLNGNTVRVNAEYADELQAAGYATSVADGLATAKAAVAKIGNTNYATLDEAINAAAEGATVTVLTDIVLSETVKVLEGKTITLDLNGKTIDGTEKVRIAIMSYGNLTIKDSSAEQAGVVKAGIGTAGNAINICGGTFTLESGNIYSKNNALLIDEQAAVVNINGGKITAEPATRNSAVMYISSTSETVVNITDGELVGYNGILLWNNTKVNVTGGSIDAKGSTAIQGNGSKDNTEISISGGSLSGYYAAIYHPQGGELNISAGTLTGWTGVVVKGGTVNISGGTISGTGEADTYRPVSSGYVDTGDALYVEHYDNSTNSENYGTPVVTVTGGTFTSANGKAVASYVNTNNNIEALAGFISGGTFSNEVAAEFCAPGYVCQANAEGAYGIVVDPAYGKVAKIGETYYATFAEAYNAAQAGETIKLLADVTVTGKLTIAKSITIDGNGHSIIADETAVWYTVSGKLNIKNYKTHLIGVNAGGITLKDIVLDNNNNAAGINVYCAQNVVFDNVSIINATKGMAALTVNGSTVTFKTAFTALGNSIAMDISNGSGVTSTLGVTVEEGTVFDLGNKTVKFASVAVNDMSGAVNTEGKPYFVAKDNAYFYTLAQIESRTTAFSNGLTLLADVELTKDIKVKGTFDLNGHNVTTSNDAAIVLTSKTSTVEGSEGLNVTTTVDNCYVVYNEGVYTVVAVTIPEVEVTDIKSSLTGSDPDLTFALNFKIKDLAKIQNDEAYLEALMNSYGNWYTDYVLTVEGLTSESVTFNANGGADGYLAGQYDAWSDSWVSVPFENVKIKNGASLYIMEYAAELMGKSGLRFTLQEIAEIVQNFNCGVFFTPEFMAANPNMKVTLDLVVFTEDEQGEKTFYNNGPVATNDFDVENIAAVVSGEDKQSQYYATFADAYAAAEAGDVVGLLADVTMSEILVLDKAITLDGNGKTLTSTATGSNARAINVSGADGVTIKNLKIDAKGERAINVIQNATNVTIDNVTATAANYTVNVAGSAANAVVTINNSNLTGLNVVNVAAPGAKVTVTGGTLTCNDQTDIESYAALAIATNASKATITATGVTFDVKGDSSKAGNGTTDGTITIDGVVVGQKVAMIQYANGTAYTFDNLAAAVAKAEAGETVKLLRDVEANEVILIDKSLTINGNGHKVTSSATRVFRVTTSNTEVTLNKVNMVSSAKVVYPNDVRGISIDIVDNVKLTLDSCSVDFTDASANDWAYAVNVTGGNNHVVTVNGGTYEGANVINVRGANNTIVVKDATLTSLYPNNDVYYGACVWVLQNQGSSVEATGNTFNGSNTMVFNVGTGTTVTESNNTDNTTMCVAKIGNDYYTSLVEAFAEVEDNEIIKVLHNVELTEAVVNTKTITLDLNGKTVVATDNATGSYAMITNKGDLTITGNGTMELTATNNRGWNAYSSVISNTVGGKLTVENGKLQHLGGTDMAYAIDNLTNGKGTYAETVINGGTIKSTYRAIRQFLNGVEAQNILTVNGGTIEGANKSIWMQDPSANANTGTLTVSAGAVLKGDVYLFVTAGSTEWPVEVSIANAALNDGAQVVTGNVPAQYVVENVNGTWGVSDAVASVDGVGYTTLAEAVAAATDCATVTVLADITLNETVTIAGKSITLDLNGKTVSGTCNAGQSSLVYVENNAALTVKDSSDPSTGKLTFAQGSSNVGWTVDVKGAFTLESGTIELTGSWSIGYAVDVRPNSWGTEYTEPSVFTMNGGKILSSDGAVRVASSSAAAHEKVSASFVMNNGVIDAAWDGVFVQQSDVIYDVLSFTMNGGKIESDLNPVRVYGPAATGYVNGSDCMSIDFNGGTMVYTGSENYEWVINEILRVGGGSSIETILASGNITASATFAQNNSLPAGYVWEANGEVYTAVAVVAEVDGVQYGSLQTAIDAAEGNTVKVLADIALTESVIVPAGKEVILDLNGKTISAAITEQLTKSFAAITNKGTLTVKDATNSGKISVSYAGNTFGYGIGLYTISNEAGVLNIEGGTIENTTTVSGSMYDAIDNNSTLGETVLNISGGEVKCAAYIGVRQFANNTTYDNIVNVTGGMVVGGNTSIWMQNPGSNQPKATIAISGDAKINGRLLAGTSTGFEYEVTGGTFNTDVTDFCMFGYECKANANGTYGVVPATRVESLELIDGQFTEFVNDHNIEVGTLTYKRKFSTSWTPFYVPFNVPVSQLAEQGFEVAYINGVRRDDTDYDGELDKFVMEIIYIHSEDSTKVNGSAKTLKPNYPYFVRATEASLDNDTLNITLNNDTLYKAEDKSYDCTTMTERFEITGNSTQLKIAEFESNTYFVSKEKNTGKTAWVNLNSGSLNPFRFYMSVTDREYALPVDNIEYMSISIRGEEREDGTTYIYDLEVNEEKSADYIYDLQGRRVLEPQKGNLYIINSKKVIF